MISARTRTDDPLPELELQLQLQSVNVKRMELFIIALDENKTIRYQVILFLTTSAGEVWSEIVLENWQKPADWINWSCRFRTCMAAKELLYLACPQQQSLETTVQSVLFASAFKQLLSSSGLRQQEIKSMLFDRASTYISLF